MVSPEYKILFTSTFLRRQTKKLLKQISKKYLNDNNDFE